MGNNFDGVTCRDDGPRTWFARGARSVALAACVGALAACASLPPPAAQPRTFAVADVAGTPLAALVRPVLASDGRSGFRLQPYGPNAFATRLQLARLATRSLDVQYYLLLGDDTGRTLMRALRDAALRGVRVRVLVDDLYTAGEDELLLALASYPNVEVRLFNPFPAGRGSELGRFIASAHDFGRLDRRMHNKLFVADNVAAVAGGRNMADDYVGNSEGRNFIDMDVFAAGPVVSALSDEFDHYWNSDVVYPVASIAHSDLGVAQLQERFERSTATAHAPPASEIPADGRPEAPVDGEPRWLPPDLVSMLNLPFELAAGRLGPLLLAPARVLFDPLAKTEDWNKPLDSIHGTVTESVTAWFHTAQSDIRMVSPYFVPSPKGLEALVEAQSAGLHVTVITNSLASTDEPAVYAGYLAHLKAVLQAGVDVDEISPSLSVTRHHLGLFGRRTGALHMKNAIVDHAQVFLGSMNLDQRSARLNTELGVIIDSPEMAAELEGFNDVGSAYRVRLNAAGRIEWVLLKDNGTTVVSDVPPETSVWKRLLLSAMSPFIPEGEL